ncbi:MULTISPECIES: helix-turn-helix transcriptional regulator [Alteromonas]|uniref:helix-turn-helix transcriptional regulator n=1 Tax=Alteromonas TaxID=226 RepID=UPI003571017B
MKKQIITTIRSDELRNILGISKSTYYRMIKTGRLPKPNPVSDRIRVFDVEEVEETLGFTLTSSCSKAH